MPEYDGIIRDGEKDTLPMQILNSEALLSDNTFLEASCSDYKTEVKHAYLSTMTRCRHVIQDEYTDNTHNLQTHCNTQHPIHS